MLNTEADIKYKVLLARLKGACYALEQNVENFEIYPILKKDVNDLEAEINELHKQVVLGYNSTMQSSREGFCFTASDFREGKEL